MHMYVRLYEDLRRGEDDNPIIGILLCGSKDHTVARYSVLHELFAGKYRLVLPSVEELRLELERERAAIDELKVLENMEKENGAFARQSITGLSLFLSTTSADVSRRLP